MNRWLRIGVSLVLAGLTSGCFGYCPVRCPTRDLLASSVLPWSPLDMPSTELTDSPNRVQKEGVSIAVEFLDRTRTTRLFGADLLRNGVQPLLVTIRNESNQPYLFRKINVGAHTVPAATVVRLLKVHPAKIAASYVRWLFFIVPGLVFDTIVEPASTFEFPGIHEAAQRPPHPDAQAIRADVMKHEIADAEVPPTETLSGLLFIRPPRLGSTIALTLINTSAHQPVVLEVPTPPAMYVERHEYVQPFETVWDAVVKSVTPIQSWKIVSTDKTQGILMVRTGLTGLAWWTASTMTITIQSTPDHKTQLTLQSPLRRATSAGYGEHSRTIDRFVQTLDAMLPQPSPTPQTSSDQPVSSDGSVGELDVPSSQTPVAP